jgi:hypothetical protein
MGHEDGSDGWTETIERGQYWFDTATNTWHRVQDMDSDTWVVFWVILVMIILFFVCVWSLISCPVRTTWWGVRKTVKYGSLPFRYILRRKKSKPKSKLPLQQQEDEENQLSPPPKQPEQPYEDKHL